MSGISVDGRNGKFVQALAEMIIRFTVDVFPKLAESEHLLDLHAEEMLPLRAVVIRCRWDEQVQRMRTWTKKNHVADWQWTPWPMS